MRHTELTIKDIVKYIDDATYGKIDIPEFQRRFVWSPEKAKALLESIWKGYPIGVILLWDCPYYKSPQIAKSSQSERLWVVDGQQRITTLALIFGKKPYWWADANEWNRYYERYDVMVNLLSPKESLEFALPNPIRRKSSQWISVREILNCENEVELSELAQRKARETQQEFAEIYGKLHSIKDIEKYSLYEIIIDQEIEDVAEIFSRLNMGGVKIRESDVMIALVAARQEGWVREELYPLLEDLEEKGFKFDPAILIRSLSAIGKGIARLRNVSQDFWEGTQEFKDGWKSTKEAMKVIIKQLQEIGILSSDLLPTHNALIPLFCLYSKFKNSFNFKKAFYWFLLATRDGRYSGSAISTLEQDIRSIKNASCLEEAINSLLFPLKTSSEFQKEDFKNEIRDGFLRLMLYLLVFKNHSKDWLYQDIRIGYDNTNNVLNEGFYPEWHHFFPQKLLKERGIEDSEINALANIVVLNERANRAFASLEPYQYMKKFGVLRERLKEQFIPLDENLWKVESYHIFVEERAEALAKAGNDFLKELKEG